MSLHLSNLNRNPTPHHHLQTSNLWGSHQNAHFVPTKSFCRYEIANPRHPTTLQKKIQKTMLPPPRLSEKSLLKFLTLQYLEGCREYCCGLQILDSRRVESVRQCHLARERGFRTIILPSRPPARPSSAYSSPSACCTQGSTGPSRPLS